MSNTLDTVAKTLVLQASIEELRTRLKRTVVAPDDPKTPPLRLSLMGQVSDALCCTQWDANKAALVKVLDALDALGI